jgi:hypothetical protein
MSLAKSLGALVSPGVNGHRLNKASPGISSAYIMPEAWQFINSKTGLMIRKESANDKEYGQCDMSTIMLYRKVTREIRARLASLRWLSEPIFHTMEKIIPKEASQGSRFRSSLIGIDCHDSYKASFYQLDLRSCH